MAASKVIAKDQNTFTASIKVTIIASIVVILMSFLGTWRTRSSHPEGLCKKGAFEHFTEENIYAGSFFNKDSGRGSATLLQRDSSIDVFFVNSVNFLKTVSLFS